MWRQTKLDLDLDLDFKERSNSFSLSVGFLLLDEFLIVWRWWLVTRGIF